MARSISLWLLLIVALILVAPGSLLAQSDQAAKLNSATQVLREVTSIPEDGIPESLLNGAYGVAVIPNAIKAAVGIGGRFGEGVLVVRHQDGTWSNPVFINLIGGSVGWQIGAESTDIVLVFNSPRSLDAINQGKFTLGADVSIAAGPVGRHAEASTDARLRAEIFSYSRTRGLFAGAAFQGAVIQIDNDANSAFYGVPDISARSLLAGGSVQAPVPAMRFTCTLASVTRSGLQACA